MNKTEMEILARTMFNFRIREPARDDDNDSKRYSRLANLLGEIAHEVALERDGLQRRHLEATTDAAFLNEAVENDAAPRRSSIRLTDLTSSILQCEHRLSVLTQQLELLQQVRVSLEGFHKPSIN